MAAPLHGERHPDSALECIKFPALKGRVARDGINRSTVITEKENERIETETIVVQRLQHFTHTIVQGRHHRRICAAVGVANVCHAIKVSLRGDVIRHLGSVIGQVKEKRLCRMAIDKRNSLAR